MALAHLIRAAIPRVGGGGGGAKLLRGGGFLVDAGLVVSEQHHDKNASADHASATSLYALYRTYYT